MPAYGTTSVAFAAGPTIVSTFLSHCVTWPTRHGRPRNAESSSAAATSLETLPGNQLRYEEGLNVVRSFLDFSSHHGVEEVQGFTAQPVPVPRWVHRQVVTIPESQINEAADILTRHLQSYGPDGGGLNLVGGGKWWQVRGRELEGEWLEMRKDYEKRKEAKLLKRKSWMGALRGRYGAVKDGSGADVVGDRVILYIHGGAFFFSSLDMHRYQIQRHARKAGARAFVPNYRLSPQYPFPCGLQDSIAAYLYLIDPPAGHHAPIAPENIILMGDSAGGGMCLSLLVVIREMGLPMPAAASLMSPWVDLTHSMPSIMQWDGGDYIPSVGFHYRPSEVWPPIPGDGIKVDLDGKEVAVDDQIQLYCPNTLLTHPLVSPINNGSLGGLCPLYISAGGAELLRDEIIYIAHKAAHPTQYPPSELTLAEYPNEAALVDKYPPTHVELQVFEGACHVATTLAWTRSAKHIFRGTANFNIWAFKDAAQSRTSSAMPSRTNSAPSAQELGLMTMSPSTTSSLPEPAKRGSTASEPAEVPSHLRTLPDSPILNGSDIAQSPVATGAATPAPSAGDLTALPMSRRTSGSGTDGEEAPPTSSDEEVATPMTPSGGHFKYFRHPLGEHILVRGFRPAWADGFMVAERVSTHGRISPMEKDGIPALDPALRPQIGRVTGAGPIRTWLNKRADWDKRYAKELKQYRELRMADRARAEEQGFLTRDLAGEHPPLASLAGLSNANLARRVGKSVDAPTHRESKAVALWAHLAEGPDIEAVKRERKSGEEDRAAKEKRNEGGRSAEQRANVAQARKSVDLGRRKSVERASGEGRRPLSAELSKETRKSLDGGKGEVDVPETLAEEKGESTREQPTDNTLEAKLKRLGV
ncbi:alpha/beta-hydrolase [Cutaneotrichosporon oleaginosum]|uniref:Alpha/beta-hydrolase n=1 Tax=Cutaneotrichosporon oleaginosum TaxID=879819 RepID=A0A0J0XU26_9TREE|nr:alpha/beta-hydrolase [Cutaneotrichosporon oleaginosum]KLT44588.1 alpha/beta-hydrolase [Cutaneotrichosporon oleaginosum]TXT13897.1 hypothetical protein COLE_00090 [Cutaneotrichosporon oleaginosum]